MLSIYVDKIENSYLNYCVFKCLNKLSEVINCNLYFNELDSILYDFNFNIEPFNNQNEFIIGTCSKTNYSDYLYVWDLEWLRKPIDTNIYLNKNLITRSESMAQELFIVSGNKADIIHKFDYYKIKDFYDRFNGS